MRALLGLACLCLLLSTAHAGTFFQISDIHVDPEYKVGADPLERCVNITANETQGAGTWGNYLCDPPMNLFESMLAAMKAIDPNPSFIFYTGDSVPHWLDYTSVEFYTEDMVKNGIATVLTMTNKAFPSVPLYPALGNHDNWLSDQFPPPSIAAPWLSFIASQWTPFIPASAVQTAEQGAYYTLLIQPGLRLISWNSIYCDRINVWAALNHSDYGGQFEWLNETLLAARQANERVYIIGHIVPSDYLTWCQERYSAISREYGDVIVMQFFGDRHTDEFRLVMNSQDDPLSAVGVIRVCPSLAPFTGHNPAFRHYTFNDSTAIVIDENTYHVQLGNGNQSSANWTLEYNLKALYGLPDLSPKSFAGLFLLLLSPGPIRNSFIEYYDSGAPYECDLDCQSGIIAAQIWGPFPQPSRPRPLRSQLPKTASGRSISLRDGKEAADPEVCTLCLAAMNIVDALFAVNASEKVIIETVIAKLCPLQHTYPPDVCHGFCWLYGPYALPVVATEKTATRLCYALPFCDSTSHAQEAIVQ